MKRILSLLLSLSLLILPSTTFAEDTSLVSSAKLIDGKVTVAGYGKNVNIFLLNPGKTSSDIATALTKETFNSVVNYCDVLNTSSAKSYSTTFKINNFDSENTYSLYVKSDADSKTITLESASYVYVSTVGNDTTGDGSKTNPYATIDKARNVVRSMDKDKPIDIIISSGTYHIGKLEFATADSGNESAPITYRAASGAKVVIDGDTTLSATDFTKVTDTDTLAKVDKTTADNLYVIDLTKYGISTGIADYLSGTVKLDVGTTPVLKLNNNRQDLARWPNRSYKQITNVYDADGDEVSRVAKDNDVSITLADATTAQLTKWADAENAYVEGYTAYDWYREWTKIVSVDASTGKIALSPASQYGAAKGFRGSVINLLEELDTPGEFYISKDMKLYYYPPYKLTSKDSITLATACNDFVAMNNCSYINFKGITFKDNTAKKSGIVIENSDNINISGCSFDDISGDCIVLTSTTDSSIDSCEFSNMGYRGITFSKCGTRSTLTASGDSVTNCVFSYAGYNSGRNTMGGIYIMSASVGVQVENNVFHNMENDALRYEGNNHYIANNEFYNCVNDSSDAGAIYAGRSFSEYGTVIKNNYFHDIGNLEFTPDQRIGAVFWDDNHSGNAFIGNLVDMGNKANTAGIRVGGGTDNVVKGNVFVNAKYGESFESGMTMPTLFTPVDSSFYTAKAYTSFLEATSGNVTNAQQITSDDWLEAFKTSFPNIMTNYSYINNNSYKRTVERSSNVIYGNDSNEYKYFQSNIIGSGDFTPSSSSAFVDYAGGDIRVTSSYKSSFGADSALPDETFSWDTLNIADTSIVDNYKSVDLVYPANGSKVSDTTTYLTWGRVAMADSYTYEVATDQNFANIVATGSTRYNQAQVSDLNEDATYYWRVTAVGESKQLGFSETSDVSTFSLGGGVNIDKATYSSTTNKVSYTISNSKDTAEPVTIAAAIYDTNGKCLGVNLTSTTVSAGASASGSLTLGGFVGKGGTVLKVMFFKDTATLSPIIAPKKFTYSK